MENLEQLAGLLKHWNAIGSQIAAVIGRPAQSGHLAEYIASQIFEIRLEDSASSKGIDGHFTKGKLKGRTVNVKYKGKNDGLLTVDPSGVADVYLVLAGPKSPNRSSRGKSRPWVIESVFIFELKKLISRLDERATQKGRGKARLGTATSISWSDWNEFEIYPRQNSRLINVTDLQRKALRLFSSVIAD